MIEVGSLRKAVCEFKAESDQELTLESGDIIQVRKWVDKHWCSGISNGKEGNFPTDYTIDLKIPRLEENQELFAPITKFVAQETGDLSFNKGDLIVGIRAVDGNWWEGMCNGNRGIFPLNYAWKIDRSCLMRMNAPRKVFKKARVKTNLKAQLDQEIDLIEGEIVIITEEIDKLWYRGEHNGKTGIFPSLYVTVISDNDVVAESIPTNNSDFLSQKPDIAVSTSSEREHEPNAEVINTLNQYGYDCVSSGITAYGQALFPFRGEYATDLTFNAGEIVKLKRHIDDKWMEGEIDGRTGMFPKNHVNIIVDCPGSDQNNFESSSFYYDSYGRVLSDFFPDGLEGVKLLENDTVTLLQKVGKDSFLVKTDKGIECVCPSSLIEEIGQGPDMLPPSYSDVMEADKKSKFSPDTNAAHMPTSSLRMERPLSYPSSAFDNASSFSASQNNFSFKSVPNIEDKIGENLSCLSSSFATNTASSKRMPHRSLSLNEQNHAFESGTANLERPAFQPSTYENLETSHLNNWDSPRNDQPSNEIQVSSQISESANRETRPSNQNTERKRAEERRKKMQEQRNCIITEIYQTEKDYRSGLKILHDTFTGDSQQAKAVGIDVAVIFGNLDEVIEISKQLEHRLNKARSDSYENQKIGQCFIDLSDDIKEVYGPYCRNHDEVNAVLDKYEERPAANQYLKFKVEIMKRSTNCFDLPSMLIKPVQRILKYPLLLNELVKCTEDGHVDKQSLIEAIALMTDAATAINEFKRRKDLVFKYRKHTDTSFSGRISKFNMHSVLKKSSRFGMRLSNTIGLTHVTKDENFQKLECQFHALEKSIKIFIKDVNVYIERTEELVKTAFRMAEDISELYGEKNTQQEVDTFRSVHRIIATQYWEANKQILNRNVLDILRQLLQAFHGPNNLIEKRADKLLDYDACSSKLEKNKDGTKVKMLQDNLQVAKNTYEALNSQLLDDLPRLHSLSIEVLQSCFLCFLKAKKTFVGRSAKEMLSLTELPLLLGSQGDILDTFQVKHNLVTDNLCGMNIVPKQFFSSNFSTLKRNSSPASSFSFGMSSQSKAKMKQGISDLQLIKSSYPTEKLYTVSQDYDAVDIMDVSLSKGDLVGVVKEQDPMGNKLRWFVDKGGSKGFVPAKILKRYVPSPQLSAYSIPQERRNVKMETRRPNSCYSTVSKGVSRPQPEDLLSSSIDTHSVPAQKPHISPASIGRESMSNPPVVHPTLDFDRLGKPNGYVSPQSNQSLPADASPHKYEEIDQILGLYDTVGPESSVRSQSLSSTSSAVLLEEFDPYGPLRDQAQLYDNVPACQETADAGHRYEEIPEDIVAPAVPDATAQYYFAMYDFSPTGMNQLKVVKGQVVRVISKWDLSHNSEWWLVEDRFGNQGYVPANYLKLYPRES